MNIDNHKIWLVFERPKFRHRLSIIYISILLGRENKSTENFVLLSVKPLLFLAIKSVITHSHLKPFFLQLDLGRKQHTVKISVNMSTLVNAENEAYLHQRKTG